MAENRSRKSGSGPRATACGVSFSLDSHQLRVPFLLSEEFEILSSVFVAIVSVTRTSHHSYFRRGAFLGPVRVLRGGEAVADVLRDE